MIRHKEPKAKSNPGFERRFDFNFPVAQFPNICVRLRGTPARLEEIVKDAATDLLTAKPDGKWSAQELAGHLFDLEPLWMARVKDFLTDGDRLTVGDLTNRKKDEANHNARTLREILADFRAARLHLVNCIGSYSPRPLQVRGCIPALSSQSALPITWCLSPNTMTIIWLAFVGSLIPSCNSWIFDVGR